MNYTGDSAFPYEYKYIDGAVSRDPGMTLRDYFAAKALLGLLGNMEALSKAANALKVDETEYTVGLAYEFADAMLEEREK